MTKEVLNPFGILLFRKHENTHLLAGEKLYRSGAIPYPAQTYNRLIQEKKSIRETVEALPFENKKCIWDAEMEALIHNLVVNRNFDARTVSLSAPGLSKEELSSVLDAYGIEYGAVIDGDAPEYNASKGDVFSIYSFEESYFGHTIGELKPLRELAKSGGFFFNIGASILGPVYALYAEWIIRFCNRHNIKLLLPMMREATMLKYCLDELGSVETDPLFCSRRSLFNASITAYNFDEKMTQVFMKSRATPSVLLKDLGVAPEPFVGIVSLSEADTQAFRNYVFENKDVILQNSQEQRTYFCRMIEKQIAGQKTATVDIGFSGTSERLIQDILQIEGSDINLSHLILMGADGAQVNNILEGLRIYSWLGMAGENTEETKRLMYQIQVIEPLINDICGTTLGFSSDEPILDEVIPTGLEANYPKSIECQDGMKNFVKVWKEYRNQYDIDKLMDDKIGFINIWRRLIETPTYEEAAQLGELLLYDNYTEEKKVYKVRDEGDTPIVDVEEYLQNVSRAKSDYPQARVVLEQPDYFKRKLVERNYAIPGIKRMLDIIEDINKFKHEKVAIFAAGQRGRDFVRIARLFNTNVVCFVDTDEKKQGTDIDGIPVLGITKAKEMNIRFFVNASYNYPEEVRNTILTEIEEPRIYEFE